MLAAFYILGVIFGFSHGRKPLILLIFLSFAHAYRFFMPPNESDTAVGFRPVLAREIR